MDSKSYNIYLSTIKTANDMADKDRAKEILRNVQAEMISKYGLSDDDVEYLIKKFRYNIWKIFLWGDFYVFLKQIIWGA